MYFFTQAGDHKRQQSLRLARAFTVGLLCLSLSVRTACAAATVADQTTPDKAQPANTKLITQLSLAQAYGYALQHLPELSAAQKALAASQAQLSQTQLRANPELSYNVEDWRGNNPSQTVQLSWPLELGNKRELRTLAAQSGVQIAQTELAQTTIALRQQVRQAYFDLLLAQQQSELSQASLDLALAFSQSVRQRISAGKLAAAEMHKASVAEKSAQLELLQAQQQQQHSSIQLQSLLGQVQWQSLDQRELELADLPPLSHLQAQLAANPALQKASLELRRRQQLTELEHAKRLPDLSLSMGLKRSRELPGQQVLIGITLPLAIFDRNQGNLAEAIQRQHQASDDYAALQRQMQTELAQAHARYLNLQQQVSILNQQILREAGQAYQAARLGFSHGKFSFLEVLDAQRSLFAQQALYLKTLGEAHKLYAEISTRFVLAQPTTTP